MEWSMRSRAGRSAVPRFYERTLERSSIILGMNYRSMAGPLFISLSIAN
jgi:hypothetical protein